MNIFAARTGDPASDWYLDTYPGGGVMIDATGFGNVFITNIEDFEDLNFVSGNATF